MDGGLDGAGPSSDASTEAPQPASAPLLMQPLDTYDWPLDSTTDLGASNVIGGQRGWIADGSGLVNTQFGDSSVILTLQPRANHWVGVWNAVAGSGSEATRTVLPDRAFGDAVKSTFQATIVALRARVRGTGLFKIEVRDAQNTLLDATSQVLSSSDAWTDVRRVLPGNLPPIKFINVVVDDSHGIPTVEIDDLRLEVRVPTLPPLRLAFLLSYAQLMRSWDATTGFADDHASFHGTVGRGSQQSVPATGFVPLATAMAVELGYVDTAVGKVIADTCIATLLSAPRQNLGNLQTGLWPHFLNHGSPTSEWSLADTSMAWHSAYLAAIYFGLDDRISQLGAYADSIKFDQLVDSQGHFVWGVDGAQSTLLGPLTDFGTEQSLPRMLQLFQNPTAAEPPATHEPPVYCDEDFIDHEGHLWYGELGAAGAALDRHGVDWHQERLAHLARSVAYLGNTFLGGLSPVEIRDTLGQTAYAALGLGTATCPLIEYVSAFDGPWRSMHSVALTADLDPVAAEARVASMLQQGLLLPLSGPAESAIVAADMARMRRHTAQVSLNSWFNVGGYYSAVVVREGLPNAIHLASTRDNRLRAALQALFP
jgi:hypothetical protein